MFLRASFSPSPLDISRACTPSTCHRDYLTRTREAGFAKENNGRGSVAPLSRLLQLVRAALC